MKKRRLLICTSLTFLSLSFGFSQDQLTQDYTPIANELQKWDPVRGEWLSKSILALANNEVIPDRTFPEDFTPYEMMTMVPIQSKESIRTIASTNRNNARNTTPNTSSTTVAGRTNPDQFWTFISEFFSRPTCTTSTGRTYGDPHFTSFDGNGYSLQSAGEFILAKSNNSFFEVQARQKPSSSEVSLNTAIAMNVGGDRLCYYADDLPDSDISTAYRLNGKPIHVNGATYYLPHGGTIRENKNEITIAWPTGEKVVLQKRNSGNFAFLNVTSSVYPCVMGGFQGLLGNANGTPNDDLETRDNPNHADLFASMSQFSGAFQNTGISTASNNAERDYLERLTREFGDYWRVTDLNTLFDYGYGRSTISYTDRTFPLVHRTIGDLSSAQRTAAQRNCEAIGLTGNELRGCIYDNGHLNIPPTAPPVIRDPTTGVTLTSISTDQIRPNVNRPEPVTPVVKPHVQTVKDVNTPVAKPGTSAPIAKPNTEPVDNVKTDTKVTTPPSTVNKPQPVVEKQPEPIKQSLPEKVNQTIFQGTTSGGGSTPSSTPIKTNPAPAPKVSVPVSVPSTGGSKPATPMPAPVKKGG